MTTNQLQYWRNVETKRSNLANENETQRHNRVGEAISANTLVETKRHNLATEKETNRSNVANEGIKQRQNSTALYQAQETARHNRAQEQNDLLKLASNERIAQANRKLGYAQLSETTRHNIKDEAIKVFGTTATSITNLIGTGIRAAVSVK